MYTETWKLHKEIHIRKKCRNLLSSWLEDSPKSSIDWVSWKRNRSISVIKMKLIVNVYGTIKNNSCLLLFNPLAFPSDIWLSSWLHNVNLQNVHYLICRLLVPNCILSYLLNFIFINSKFENLWIKRVKSCAKRHFHPLCSLSVL
jgi:hypothetical protein